MSTPAYYTEEGLKKLQDELHRMKTIDRPHLSQQIADARDKGDLSENAEYHAAREQQGFIEGRIKSIEHELSHCEIIDVTHLPPSGKVVFGATVSLEDQDGGAEIVFQIVGEAEADVRLGLISITSPIARALVGKGEGDVVDVAVPGGTRALEIVTIRYV